MPEEKQGDDPRVQATAEDIVANIMQGVEAEAREFAQTHGANELERLQAAMGYIHGLTTLNEGAIKRGMSRLGIKIPKSQVGFWEAVHLTRLKVIPDLPPNERELSRVALEAALNNKLRLIHQRATVSPDGTYQTFPL